MNLVKEAADEILGAMMLPGDEGKTARAAMDLPPEAFGQDAEIVAAIRELDQSNLPVDPIAVADRLQAKGLRPPGGYSRLVELSAGVVTTAALEAHKRLLRRELVRGQVVRLAERLKAEALEADDPEKALEAAIQAGTELDPLQPSGAEGMKRVMLDAFDYVSKRQEAHDKGCFAGVATHFPELDMMTSGFDPGDLVVIAGRPSMGKTSFALDIARNAAMKSGTKVLVFSLEMTAEQLGTRMVCALADVDIQHARLGILKDYEWPRISDAMGRLADLPIWVDDTGNLDVQTLCMRARAMKMRHGIGLVVVDYVQKVRVPKSESRRLEVSAVGSDLKSLAKAIRVPVIAVSQLSRLVELRSDKRPTMADLKESGDLEQDADTVLLLYRDDYYNKKSDKPGVAEVIVAKQRNGPTGGFELTWRRHVASFASISKREPDRRGEAA